MAMAPSIFPLAPICKCAASASKTLPALQAELAALGLLDSDPRAEAVRNVVPSPLAGFDPTALIDARPLVEALDALLIREKALHDLPPKFGFSVDGRGVLPLRGVETDIGFAAFLDDEGPRLRVALGGIVVGSITPGHFMRDGGKPRPQFSAPAR